MYQLRELEYKDLTQINQWRNNPELIKLLGAPFRFINNRVDEKWFDNYMENRASTVRCAIVEKEKDIALGLISLVSIDYMNQSAELHIMIGSRENRGRGIGSFALKEMLKHAFINMNLHRIELQVVASNVQARYFYQKLGFDLEGTKKKARFKNGEFVDMEMYAILKDNSKYTCDIYGGGVKHNPPVWLILYHINNIANRSIVA